MMNREDLKIQEFFLMSISNLGEILEDFSLFIINNQMKMLAIVNFGSSLEENFIEQLKNIKEKLYNLSTIVILLPEKVCKKKQPISQIKIQKNSRKSTFKKKILNL